MIIAAYMMYKIGYTADAAIAHFKSKRSGSLKKSGQVNTLKVFEKCKRLIISPGPYLVRFK